MPTLREEHIAPHRERFLHELIDFCRQPSISSTGEGVREMSLMVAERLRRLGATTRSFTVGQSFPYVFAEIGSGPRTLLIYNHYDVQPARREDGWLHDPFEPQLRDGRMFARGVADNKANLLFRIQALETYMQAHGDLPLRVCFLMDGEEEIGSPHLTRFLHQHSDLIQAHGCIWESGRKGHDNRPLLHLGVRGILYVELSIEAPCNEVHSSWASIVQNPAFHLLGRLRQALESLTDETGRPTFGNLLESVTPPTPDDLDLLDDIPFDLATFQVERNILLREELQHKQEALRRLFFEPTCNICGLYVGYGAPGVKTIIPRRAVAKVDFRLPCGLTPDLVEARLRTHLHTHGFADVHVQRLGALLPGRTPLDAEIVRVTRRAVQKTYGVQPIIYPVIPASGPMYELCHANGIPALTFGTGHAGDNVHAANENIYLDDYFQAIQAFGDIIRYFGAGSPEA